MKNTLDLTFRSKENNALIPAKDVYETLMKFQDLMYTVAGMKAKLSSSKKGRKSESMINICELLIADVKQGSVTISLVPKSPELDLFGYNSFGKDVLNDTGKIYSYVATNDENNIKKIIPDDYYRTKIINKIQATIPSEKSTVNLYIKTIATGQFKTQRLAPELLKEITIQPLKLVEEEVTHQLVDIIGIAALDSEGTVKKLENIYNVNTNVKGMILDRVEGNIYSYVFTKELFFKIKKTDNYITVQQSDLNIDTYYQKDEDLHKALGEELDFLWTEYAETEDKYLHSTGIAFKKNLLSLIFERKIYSASKNS